MYKSFHKVPVVMQMEALECGAACLAMVLGYYGKWIPIEQIRKDCAVSRDGSNLYDMARAAESYGLVAEAYSCDIEDFKKIKLPAIIHWKFNHFVVLCKIKKNKVYLNDPAKGKICISMQDFDANFTGIVLSLKKGKNFCVSGKRKSVFNFIKQRLKHTGQPLLFVFLTSLLITLSNIISPGLSRVFIDRILIKPGHSEAQNPTWLYPIILTMSALIAFQLIVKSIKEIYMLKIRGKIAIVSNSIFMWHTLRLPIDFFLQRDIGDIAERQASNENITESLIQTVAPVLLDLATLIFYLIIIIKISIPLTLIGLASSLLNIIIARYISKKRINISRCMIRDMGKLASITISGINMIETIKSSGAENGFFERWSGLQASVNNSKISAQKINSYIGSIPEILRGISDAIVLSTGILLIMTQSSHFSLGILMQFQVLLSRVIQPIDKLRQTGQQIQETRTLMERIDDVLNYKPDVDYDKSAHIMSDQNCQKLTGKIELKNVSFGYKMLDEPLIKNFNLSINPGNKIAIVGSSGCGKSTIARLISGLYKQWSGEILFDGKPIDQIPREVFTASLSTVDQSIVLFEGNISENIRMWDDSITDEEMINAAKRSRIHDDIRKLEYEYNQQVNENGKNFSGGQRQRIEIARALSSNPSIIILDEATSSLDAQTEFQITRSIAQKNITCIIIAHRLSTIRDCDEIIVLDNGKIVERGTHSELFARSGKYKKLISME